MKNIKRKFIALLILCVFATVLSGCEFTFLQSGPPIQISGYVMFEETPLEGVKIVSDFIQYTTTNQDGFYSFETRNKNLIFYARKTGYNFTPKTYDIKQPQTTYNFEGVPATQLNGTLSLEQILVAPISIVSIPGNNFEYISNGNPAMKFYAFKLKLNSNPLFTITSTEPYYLPKHSFTNVLLDEMELNFIVENGKVNFTFEFELKAYYHISSFSENISSEKKPIIYRTNTTLDTGDLDEESNIKFSIPSINSSTDGFTYNLQFVFKYTPN